ncbi:starch synthase (maltosyl-transferring) [Leifsonia sp. AK011]|uniref:alpha-1,4-glucan--maltose-1-phosphate maltosyltransferase n=1 Tax=Leifsonia sp. AK011 TaxID=2723075 RepID=UPI0015C84E49|nr:alpha-1,4-glucan--maltose-1-phosphate maltosyltransferase [Leifsonia sp. AK011]NYF11215.1 starch synthase (maltosyl-transferring) [Leifsonia sp. AK011]
MATEYEPALGRIPIRHLAPQVPENRWPSKAFAGEVVPFEATVFREGHDLLGVQLLLTDPVGQTATYRMRPIAPGTDRWRAEAQLPTEGTWTWKIRAFNDDWATWLHNAEIKIPARVDVDLMVLMGSQLLARAGTRKVVKDAAAAFADASITPDAKLAIAQDPKLTAAIDARPLASLTTESETLAIRVERARAGLGSWYEFFPRSEGAKRAKDGTWTSGTFRTAARRLPAVAEMGFDVLYLPPIHPIGHQFRKGPNNTLVTQPGDPGSPWAIGSADGGHDTVHPDLGTIKDFTYFLGQAKKAGLEVALDFALQASPDHPWVTEHPEWFTTLPDGTIAFAENPPKKYQDIYPINFDNDPSGIRAEVLRLLRYWIGLGVRIFRVDNPHTKPLRFWELVLHEINEEYPDVVFLAEAFTRPAMLYSLAQVGFQQSYTYFTWRNTKEELAEFFTSISHETSAFLRPNLFVNTPDILTEYLQFGGVPAYRIRAGLAATASPSWGVYAGFELFEHVARPGSEENIDNEKYEYKQRDWATAEKNGVSLAPYLTTLNLIRAAHPALRQLRNLDVHWSDDDSIFVYSKYLDGAYIEGGETDALIIVANVDPHSVRETTVHLDLSRIGLESDARFTVRDLLTGERFEWGADNYVRLDAFTQPMHILHVEYPKGKS